MKGLNIIDKYRDKQIDNVVYSHASDIDTVAHVLGIDSNYLSSQVRLHIPWYSEKDLNEKNGLITIREILSHLKSDLSEFNVNYMVHRKLNGIDSIAGNAQVLKKGENIWIEDSSQKKPQLYFSDIPATFGLEIQKSMHYIHHAREDTIFHFGLVLEKYVAPLCYAAFSELDRKYLIDALNHFLPTTCTTPKKVMVMTRAFGYNPLPKNMMSTLFSCSSKRLKENGYDYIITALNPFLGFRGSIFLGASYFPFATSPMRYIYDRYGSYINRRSATSNVIEQNYTTPPILWLVHPLKRRDLNILENWEDYVLYDISRAEYLNG